MLGGYEADLAVQSSLRWDKPWDKPSGGEKK
jgi:hypothetical protein